MILSKVIIFLYIENTNCYCIFILFIQNSLEITMMNSGRRPSFLKMSASNFGVGYCQFKYRIYIQLSHKSWNNVGQFPRGEKMLSEGVCVTL